MRRCKSHKVVAVLIVLATTCLPACGTYTTVLRDEFVTVQNLKSVETYCTAIPRVYSGVAYDACKLHAKPVHVHDEGLSEIDGIRSVPFAFLDIFLSLVLDTAALPYTLYQQQRQGNIEITE
ncbi:MAG: YceK/YidQ family lipoprotein [Gammaproteobacteria bacterium]|nr:MAG: YceK/YidQ family lipoprotein [Gammaproteobacteria bacterium]